MGYWACARTEPSREDFAVKMLAIKGFRNTYLPRIKAARRLRHNRMTSDVPLFANYLFLVIEDHFYEAMWCPGVARLLLDGDRPAKVRDGVIEALKAREVNGFVKLPEPPGQFKAGDKVRVIHGPFTGLPGLYAGQSAKDRVRVLLTLFGSSRPVMMMRVDIEAVT
jgi:transcriptional antiterminator RfaH